MKQIGEILLMILLASVAASCSVISDQVRSDSEKPLPFGALVENVDNYIGKTFILGGYIIDIKNSEDETILTVLQSPLMFRGEPKSKDASEGRIIVIHKGFLDPEVFSRNRKITVAGKVMDRTGKEEKNCPSTCLKVESREIYLWEELRKDSPYPYYFYGPYYHHRLYYRYPRYW